MANMDLDLLKLPAGKGSVDNRRGMRQDLHVQQLR
jgi:hypothetical protein